MKEKVVKKLLYKYHFSFIKLILDNMFNLVGFIVLHHLDITYYIFIFSKVHI